MILCRKRIIGGKNEPPHVRLRERDKVVFPRIRIFRKYNEIEKSFLQFIGHLLGIAADDVILQLGVAFLQRFDRVGDVFDSIGLRKTEKKLPAGDIVQREEFLFDLVRHADKVFCSVAEQNSLICQTNTKAVTRKQLFVELILQGFQRL